MVEGAGGGVWLDGAGDSDDGAFGSGAALPVVDEVVAGDGGEAGFGAEPGAVDGIGRVELAGGVHDAGLGLVGEALEGLEGELAGGVDGVLGEGGLANGAGDESGDVGEASAEEGRGEGEVEGFESRVARGAEEVGGVGDLA